MSTFLEATTATAAPATADHGDERLKRQMAGRTQRRRIKTKHRLKIALKPRVRPSGATSSDLLRYLYGARKHFQGHASITVAMDGCRSGCKNRMNTWVASADNVGAWAPPIVLGDSLIRWPGACSQVRLLWGFFLSFRGLFVFGNNCSKFSRTFSCLWVGTVETTTKVGLYLFSETMFCIIFFENEVCLF